MLGNVFKNKNYALEWNLNKLNLHGFLGCANIRIFPTTRLVLSLEQALLSFSWVNRFPANSTCVPELRVLANRTMIVASLACAFTWLLWHQTDLKLNTSAFAATYHEYWSVQHEHPKNVDKFGKNQEGVIGRDPFNQNSNRPDREKWSTSKGGPVFSKLFLLDRSDPLSF